MRGAAGGLGALAALCLGATLAGGVGAAPLPLGGGLEHDVRELDGAQLLVDEPYWICTDAPGAPAEHLPGFPYHPYELRCIDGRARTVRLRCAPVALTHSTDPVTGSSMPRAGEFTFTFGYRDSSDRTPLLEFANGIPAGAWEVHRAGAADSSRVLARFRVVEPRGSERSVRDALARAARLTAGHTEAGAAEAARLYDAILRRYPRTSYLSVVYVGMWHTRAHNRFGSEPSRWLEEVFARFHESCFGTAALDQWVRDVGPAEARKTVAHLAALYPDTPLARAARRYL